jgi:hypothetical protein
MAKKFKRQAEDEPQAQSFVRNGIRRLIRDGWVEKASYGTYAMTKDGKKWVKECKETTISFGTKRGRKPKAETEAAAKKTTKKAAKKTTKKATKKVSKKATAKASKGNGMRKAVKAPAKVRKAKNKAAKKRVGPAAAKDRASELAAELAAEQATN